MPAALIYVAEPLHLRLLSIKLYNIPPIVHLPALSALPRPVGRTRPARTSKTAVGWGWGGGASDERGGVQQIGGGEDAGMRGEIDKW